MSEDWGYSERRSKRKDKFKRKKLFPYKRGGKFRTKADKGVVK